MHNGGMQVFCPSCQKPQTVADGGEAVALSCTTCGHTFSTAVNSETVDHVPLSAAEETAEFIAGELPEDLHSRETVIRPELQRAAPPASAPKQKTFAGYELLEEIARGGMGVVYKARQKSPRRVVALKMILSGQLASKEEIARFYSEAEAAAALEHPNIVPIYEAGEQEDRHFFSMAFVEGQSLSDKVRQGPLPPREAAELMKVIGEAMAYAHDHDIIHRDLKPANILLDQEGQPRITDFGLAKNIKGDSNLTATGQIMGTPSYMPPEQASGKMNEIGPAADIYSLGAVLYCLLTGRPPFQAASVLETITLVIEKEPVAPRTLNPSTPRDLETICLKCLEKNAERRYASAGEFASELQRYLNDEPILARRIGALHRGLRWCRRNRLATGLFATILLTLISLGAGLNYRARLANAAKDTAYFQELARASDIATKAAKKAAEAERRAKSTAQYASLVAGAKEKSLRKKWGWTQSALDDVRQSSGLETDLSNPEELRSLAAGAFAAFDFTPEAVLAADINTAAIAFSPDGRWLAAGELKHGLAPKVLVYDTQTHALAAQYSFSNLSLSAVAKLFLHKKHAYHDGIRCLAFSSDGRWLAAGARFGRLLVWDTQEESPTPRSCQAFADDEEVFELYFGPHDASVLARSKTGTLGRWAFLSDAQAVELHSSISSFDVSAARGIAVTLGETHLKIHDLTDLNRTKTAPVGEADFVRFSPPGDYFATRIEVGAFALLSARTLLPIGTLRKPDGGIGWLDQISFLPNGSVLAVSGSSEVGFFSPHSERWLGEILVANSDQLRATFSPTGGQFAMIGTNEKVQLYRVRVEDCVAVVAQQDSQLQDVAWSADSHKITCLTTEQIYLKTEHFRLRRLNQWDIESGQLLSEQTVTGISVEEEPGVHYLHATPHKNEFVSTLAGAGLLVSSVQNGRLRADRLANAHGVSSLNVQQGLLSVAAPGAKHAIVDDADASNGKALRIEQAEKKWRINVDLSKIAIPDAPDDWLLYVVLKIESPSPVGPVLQTHLEAKGNHYTVAAQHLSSGGAYDVLPVANVHRKDWPALQISFESAEGAPNGAIVWIDRLIIAPESHIHPKSKPLGPLAFSPDGTRLWLVNNEMELVGLTYPALQRQASWRSAVSDTAQKSITSLTAGNTWTIAGGDDGDLRFLKNGKYHNTVKGPGGEIVALAFAADEKSVVLGTATGAIRIVAVPSGQTIADLPEQELEITSLALSSDGVTLMIASNDQAAQIWRRRGEGYRRYVRLPLDGQNSQLRLSPDGAKLVIFSRGHSGVRLWRLDRLKKRFQKLGISEE